MRNYLFLEILQTISMFTYNIQLAGYPHDKFDEKGEINFIDFLDTFDRFPWLDQADKFNTIQEGCSATISVKSVGDNKDLWVSIAGDRKRHIFLVGITYIRKKKGFWGLAPEKSIRWGDIYEIEATEQIKSLFQTFFKREFDRLMVDLSALKKFDSMEAYM
jgi:hypothetical protein